MKPNKMMNYQFPDINHIDDVVPHIEDRPEFRIMVKDWYTVINYMVGLEDTFSLIRHRTHYNMWIRRECRGLIFDTETGQLISRPYHKFFNAGERDETQLCKINLYEPHVILEKLDGSMIRPIPTKEGFRLGTKAGITDVAMNAEVFIADKKYYALFIEKCFQRNITPIFEWCSRKNRIVVDYPEDQLILTAMRNVFDGSYVTYEVMKNYATAWGIPVVKAFASNTNGETADNIEDVVEQIRKWDDGEGVVIRFDNGHMVKIKADDYVLRHKSKDAINQEKNVIETILNDSVDDLIPLLTPEDAERVKAFQNAFWASVTDLCIDMNHLFDMGNKKYPDKKDFAVEYVQKEILPIYAPIMYGMKNGKGSKQIIVDMIRKSLTTQTKVDGNRWLFGGLNWNYSSIDTMN
jgi:RNA ligase